MTKSWKRAVVAAAALVGSGCAAAHPGIVNGGFYSGYQVGASVGPAETATKRGEACAVSILGLIAVGDASIEAAKREGNVTRVAAVDHEAFNILMVYGSLCTIVSGE